MTKAVIYEVVCIARELGAKRAAIVLLQQDFYYKIGLKHLQNLFIGN